MYVLNLMDVQSGTLPLLLIGCCETVCIGWFYGVDRFSDNIQEMTGYRPSLWWRICWKYITPLILFVLLLFTVIEWSGITYGGTYKYPVWAEVIGWMLAFASMGWIIVYLVIAVFKTKGTLKEVSVNVCMYVYRIYLN